MASADGKPRGPELAFLPLLPRSAARAAEEGAGGAGEGAGGASSPPVSTPQAYQAAKPQTSPLIPQETRDAGGGPWGC